MYIASIVGGLLGQGPDLDARFGYVTVQPSVATLAVSVP